MLEGAKLRWVRVSSVIRCQPGLEENGKMPPAPGWCHGSKQLFGFSFDISWVVRKGIVRECGQLKTCVAMSDKVDWRSRLNLTNYLRIAPTIYILQYNCIYTWNTDGYRNTFTRGIPGVLSTPLSAEWRQAPCSSGSWRVWSQGPECFLCDLWGTLTTRPKSQGYTVNSLWSLWMICCSGTHVDTCIS